MVSFSGIIGLEKKELVETPRALSATIAVSDDSYSSAERVDAKELEGCYVYDPIVFNSVNKLVQTIMGAGWELRCDGEKSEETLNYFSSFLDNIGEVGEETTWEEMLSIIFQNQLIYGKHYIENVYNFNMKKIVDLVSLDPKKIDYARDNLGKVVLDENGRPLGYVQTVPMGVDTTGRGDPAPENVSLGNNKIFIRRDRIAHFKLYTYGDRFDGLGVVEPAYKSIVRRQNIEEAQANSIFTRGTYPVIAYVGDKEHYPTNNMIDNAINKISNLQHNRYFAFPYWYNVKPLEVQQSEIVDNTMRYLRENSSASLGLPLAFAVGSGEATNRATLTNQQQFLEFTLNDIVQRTIATIRKQIFKRICKLKRFPSVPYLVWGDVGAENVDDKSVRLNNYVKNGILLPEDVRSYALRSEELGELENSEKKNSKNVINKIKTLKNLSEKKNIYSEDISNLINLFSGS